MRHATRLSVILILWTAYSAAGVHGLYLAVAICANAVGSFRLPVSMVESPVLVRWQKLRHVPSCADSQRTVRCQSGLNGPHAIRTKVRAPGLVPSCILPKTMALHVKNPFKRRSGVCQFRRRKTALSMIGLTGVIARNPVLGERVCGSVQLSPIPLGLLRLAWVIWRRWRGAMSSIVAATK